MIDTFLVNLFSGVYPYVPRPYSNIPGPFPFYFVLVLPFHLIGEIGYFSIVGFLLFSIVLRDIFNLSEKKSLLTVMALVLSISFAWEMYARSTIFANMVVAILYLYVVEKVKPDTWPRLLLVGLMGGLILSTRSIAAIPITICICYRFVRKRDWAKFLIVGGMIAVGFLSTLVPLYLWSPQLFLRYNPLGIQAFFLPKEAMLTLIIASVFAGAKSSDIFDCFFYSGMLIFVGVGLSFVMSVFRFGWMASMFENVFDISYFVFPLPFLLFSLYRFEVKSKRMLGNIEADSSRDKRLD